MLPALDRSALAKVRSTCSMALIPLSTSDTSGWFHTHCSAHSAGVL
jgi:hypothetical protein